MGRLLLFVLIFVPGSLLADETASVVTDSWVRVKAPSLAKKPIVGRVHLIEPDGLVLAPRTRIPFDAMTKIELSLGQKPVGESARSGAWKGALLVGGLVAAAAIENYDDWDNPNNNTILFAILGGGAVGGAVGGLYGALRRPERWISISPVELKRYAPPGYDRAKNARGRARE